MEKLESLEIVNNRLDALQHKDFGNLGVIEISKKELNQIKQDLEIAQIFKNRMRILERDNYKVIKVDIFSDVPGFIEEYNKIIDWRNECDEQ